MYAYVCIYVCNYVCMYVNISLCLFICLSACLSACLLIYTSIYIVWQPPMNESRIRLVNEAFAKMDKTGDGIITISDLINVYDYREHSQYKNGQKTAKQVYMEFLDNFDVEDKGVGEVWCAFSFTVLSVSSCCSISVCFCCSYSCCSFSWSPSSFSCSSSPSSSSYYSYFLFMFLFLMFLFFSFFLLLLPFIHSFIHSLIHSFSQCLFVSSSSSSSPLPPPLLLLVLFFSPPHFSFFKNPILHSPARNMEGHLRFFTCHCSLFLHTGSHCMFSWIIFSVVLSLTEHHLIKCNCW